MQTFENKYKNKKLRETNSEMEKKKKEFMTLLVLLQYILLVL